MKHIITFFILILVGGCMDSPSKSIIRENFQIALDRYENILTDAEFPMIPRSVQENQKLKSVGIYDWTSGFFGGSLWYLYEYNGDEKWKQAALRWTEVLDSIQYWSGNHDVGFMINCSYGNGLRLDSIQNYQQVLVNAAASLCKRYQESTGCLESWDTWNHWGDTNRYDFPVIVDNMMNLELLFRASEISGNPYFREVAETHAKTTMRNHYRDDYSSFHVVAYDTLTGKLTKGTHQGFADNSAWSRGQAWGFYGYVVCFRETQNPVYLDQAKAIAQYLMNAPTLPEDKVPLWDYHVGQPGYQPPWNYQEGTYLDQQDASAAAIMASALLELSTMVESGETYRQFAIHILEGLSSDKHRYDPKEAGYFVLKNSVGSIPHGSEIGVPLNYADYYFLEALLRLQKMENE